MRPSLATSALLALAASTLVAAESGLRAFPAADLDFYEDGDFHRRLHCDVQSEQDCVKACKVDNGCEGATSSCTKVSYRMSWQYAGARGGGGWFFSAPPWLVRVLLVIWDGTLCCGSGLDGSIDVDIDADADADGSETRYMRVRVTAVLKDGIGP